MQDVYENIDEYHIDKECKILIVFDDIIADMTNNKKLNSKVTAYQRQKVKHFYCFYYTIMF